MNNDDKQLMKLIDEVQPQSQATIKLCERLGYNAKDLQFQSYDSFKCPTPQLQESKYRHYQRRVLQIINEINKIRQPKRRAEGGMKLSGVNFIDKISLGKSDESEVSQTANDSKKTRQKITQNLIFDELLREKQKAEYWLKQQERDAKPRTQIVKVPVLRTQTKRNRSNSDEHVTRRNEYFLTEQLTDSRVQEIRSQKLNRGHTSGDYMEKVKELKDRIHNEYEEFHRKTIDKLEQRGIYIFAQIIRELYRQKAEIQNKLLSEKIEIRNYLSEQQMQYHIAKQCKKMEEKMKQNSQPTQLKALSLDTQKSKLVLQHQRTKANLEKQREQQQLQLQDQYNTLSDRLLKVNQTKQYLLTQKSQAIKEMNLMKQEDLHFNQSRLNQQKQESDSIILKKGEFINERNKQLHSNTQRKKNKLVSTVLSDRNTEEELWSQAKQAAQIFQNTTSYRDYKQNLKVQLLKQDKGEKQCSPVVQMIEQLLPKEQADKLLMPVGLQEEVMIQLNKLKVR